MSLSLDQAIAIALRDNRELVMTASEARQAKIKSLAKEPSRLDNRKDNDLKQDIQPQYLYNGCSQTNAIKQTGGFIELIWVALDKPKLRLVLKVRKTFYTALLACEFADLNKGLLENIQFHLRILQADYDNRPFYQEEIFKTKESLSSAQEAYELSLSQVEDSSTTLRYLLHIDTALKIKPVGKFGFDVQELLYDEGVVKALRKSVAIKEYQREKKTRQSIYIKKRQNYKVASLSYSLASFDRWATQAKLDRQIKEKIAVYDEQDVGRAACGLGVFCLDLENALNNIKFTQAQAKFYKRKVSIITKRRASGRASPLDLDDARLTYTLAEFNRKEAIYDYILAKEEFEKAGCYNQVRAR